MKIKNFIIAVIFILAIIILYWAFTPNTAPHWTGFNPYDNVAKVYEPKTLWDWLDLLIVPSVLSIGVWFLSSKEKEIEQIVEKDRQRQNTLDTFVDQLSKLILENNLKSTNVSEDIRILARTYALAVFRGLDKERKAEALQFLQEAQLISSNPVVLLKGANLREANLQNAELWGAEIKGAYFKKATFKQANLTGANLCGCDLSYVDFTGATLIDTDLSDTILKHANLRNVDLTKANLFLANVDGADLRGAKLSKKQWENLAYLNKAKLHKNDLPSKLMKGEKKNEQ